MVHLGFGTVLGGFQFELVVRRRLPELLVALGHADEPWLAAGAVGGNYSIVRKCG
jgi:hypothetical protein